VQARMSAMAKDAKSALELMQPLEAEIRKRLGNKLYSDKQGATISSTVLEMLIARGETVSFAESCTGGQLAATLIALL